MSDGAQPASVEQGNQQARLYTLHDDLAPLASEIMRTSDMLVAQAMEPGVMESALSDLRAIGAAAQRLREMVDVILHPHRIDAGTLDLRWMRHELRTPLTHVMGYSDMLLEKTDTQAPDNFVAALRHITDLVEICLDRISST